MQYPIPEEIRIPKDRSALLLTYQNHSKTLPAEYLRVLSPSAEVRGHAPNQAILQTGKRDITIVEIDTVGQYALKIVFSDGHDSGLYDWDYLYLLAHEYEIRWENYLQALAQANASREISHSSETNTSTCTSNSCHH